MSRNVQDSGLASITPMDMGVNGNFTKNYFDGKCIKCLDMHTKLNFSQPSSLLTGVVMEWGTIHKYVLLFNINISVPSFPQFPLYVIWYCFIFWLCGLKFKTCYTAFNSILNININIYQIYRFSCQ